MKIYAEEKEKQIIKECFNYFPNKKSFKTLRYIIDVNYKELPKTIFKPETAFSWESFDKVKFHENDGMYILYSKNTSDIYYKEIYKYIPSSCLDNYCKSNLYHTIIHELSHHYFITNGLYKDWKDAAKKKDKTITQYARKNISEFFAEHYVAFTTEKGTDWLDKNRPDVLYLLEKLWT